MSTPVDGLRLAVGTLTAVPVPPPSVVDRRTARWAVLLAPLAVLPLGIAAGLVILAGQVLMLPSLVVALLVVGVLAAGTRALHADGLSDVADGLTASYDAERSLAVMKSGASGPAGTVALLVVLGLQAAGINAILQPGWGSYGALSDAGSALRSSPDIFVGLGVYPSATSVPIAVAVLVCLSRWALLVTCIEGAPAARTEGLGTPFAGCVPRVTALTGAVALVVLAGATGLATQAQVLRGALTAVVALAVVGVLLRRAVRRFGGTTGDVHGAGIELALAVLLVGLAPTSFSIGFAG